MRYYIANPITNRMIMQQKRRRRQRMRDIIGVIVFLLLFIMPLFVESMVDCITPLIFG